MSSSHSTFETPGLGVEPVWGRQTRPANPRIIAAVVGATLAIMALMWPTFTLLRGNEGKLRRLWRGSAIVLLVIAPILSLSFVALVWSHLKEPELERATCRVTDATLAFRTKELRSGRPSTDFYATLRAVEVATRDGIVPAVSGDDERLQRAEILRSASERVARFQPGRLYPCWYHISEDSREVFMDPGDADTPWIAVTLAGILIALAAPGIIALLKRAPGLTGIGRRF